MIMWFKSGLPRETQAQRDQAFYGNTETVILAWFGPHEPDWAASTGKNWGLYENLKAI